MSKGKIILVSGPSGVGKKTILDGVTINNEFDLLYSISYTTRPKREHEEHGKDYFFVSEEEFLNCIANNEFIEYVKFCEYYYGTPKSYVNKLLEEGKNVLLEIEVEGAKKVLEEFDHSIVVSFFIVPPSIEVLEQRLISRNTETKEVIAKRIAKATQEIKEKDMYQYIIVNDDVKTAQEEIRKIIKQNI